MTLRSLSRSGLALALGLALGGCSLFAAPAIQRGNRVDSDQISQLTPGVQTEADVRALLGSPTATGTFDRNAWYYISAVSRIRPGRYPGLSEQRVVAITFDDRGVIKQIREIGPDDMQDAGMVARTTPVPGTERTLLQALFGNVGRVGAAGLGDTDSPGGGPGR